MRIAWDPGQLITDKARQLSASQKALKDAAVQFESLFLQQMLKAMRDTVPESELFGKRNAEKLFQSMHDEQLAIEMAHAGGIGLSDMIYRQMVMYVSADD
ncbi:MAG TPA: flagellar biosynthesis protein FlgJ [Firmicutes bacterium]|nr:flagellar biosynthesis protein FlgJ [Bacillota bacterium]